MTICLGKSSSFGLLCVSFMNFINLCSSFPFSFDGGLWNLIVLIPDHCLSIYFSCLSDVGSSLWQAKCTISLQTQVCRLQTYV